MLIELMSPATYSLVYTFLKTNSHDKAAAALKKSVKDVVVLKDDTNTTGVDIDEIVKQWKSLAASKENTKPSDS